MMNHLNRRQFLSTAFKVGGVAALASLGLSPKEIDAYVQMMVIEKPAAAAGPDTWYYTGAGSTGMTEGLLETGSAWGDSITIGQGGNITQMGVWLGASTGTGNNATLMLIDGGQVRRCVEIQGSSLVASAWNDVSVTAWPVSTSDVVSVYIITAGSTVYPGYAGANGGYLDTSYTYSGTCAGGTPGTTDDYELYARVYVD